MPSISMKNKGGRFQYHFRYRVHVKPRFWELARMPVSEELKKYADTDIEGWIYPSNTAWFVQCNPTNNRDNGWVWDEDWFDNIRLAGMGYPDNPEEEEEV